MARDGGQELTVKETGTGLRSVYGSDVDRGVYRSRFMGYYRRESPGVSWAPTSEQRHSVAHWSRTQMGKRLGVYLAPPHFASKGALRGVVVIKSLQTSG